jgi:AcrR family transcriptional regulator
VVKRTEPHPSRGRAEEGARTRARLVDAALQTLIEEGYAATSARAIAARGNVNPALVFYHFGGVDELLLAALDRSSDERLAAYREAMARPGTPDELVRRAADLFRQDVDGGHVTAVTELIGAGLSRPALRTEMIDRMRPWLELVREVFEREVARSPFQVLAPAAGPAAFAVVAAYLGLNMLTRFMPDRRETDALFALIEQFARLLPLVPSPGPVALGGESAVP